MANRSQIKPPVPRSLVNRYRVTDNMYVGKEIKMTSSTSVRHVLTPLNVRNENAVASPSETIGFEFVNMGTMKEVDALLNEKFVGRMFDSKAKLNWMIAYVKKLKACIKLFQKGFGDLVVEKENVLKMLESSERKCVESEAAMKRKEDKLSATIFTLEMYISSLKESLANEESAKLDALDCHKREKEARVVLAKNQEFLREELQRAKQSALNANEKVKTQEDMYKRLQEYNTGLQQYNTKLQNELQAATGAKKQVEREKAVILENLSTLRAHHNSLRKEFTSANITQDEVSKQKEAAVKKLS